jgi:hypothetical protein
MSLNAEQIRTLFTALHFTKDHELTCDEWLAELPEYLDSTPTDQASERFRLVREHLALCPECSEELSVVIDTLAVAGSATK